MPVFTNPITFVAGMVTSVMLNRLNTMHSEAIAAYPAGEIVTKTSTLSTTGTGVGTQSIAIGGWTGNVVVGSSRRITLRVNFSCSQSVADARGVLEVSIGGTVRIRAELIPPTTAAYGWPVHSYQFTLNAGAHTIAATITKGAGPNANMSIAAGAILQVIDEGAA